MAFVMLLIAGALLGTSSCGPKKQKIDDTTVMPIKDKAELDMLLDLPILPDYSIEGYYTRTDLVNGDKRFILCCKFLEKVSPDQVQKIVALVDSGQYPRWFKFDMGKKNDMHLFYDLDTTLTADRKMPDFLGKNVHISIVLPCRENDSWKEFEVEFRNNRADYSIIVDRDTLTKVLGVEMPPLKETTRSDESIYFEFDTVPSEAFYQALEKAPHWSVSRHGDMTFYSYNYDDGNYWITADLVKGETQLSFYREKSINGIDDVVERVTAARNKKAGGK